MAVLFGAVRSEKHYGGADLLGDAGEYYSSDYNINNLSMNIK